MRLSLQFTTRKRIIVGPATELERAQRLHESAERVP